MNLDQDTWIRVYPFLEQAQDIGPAELDAWIARVAGEHPDIAEPLRDILRHRADNAALDFLERPLRVAFLLDRPSAIARNGAFSARATKFLRRHRRRIIAVTATAAVTAVITALLRWMR